MDRFGQVPMKDTYWLVVGCIVGVALAAWFGAFLGKRSVARRLARGEFAPAKPSIWTRDLLDNPIGSVIRRFVFPTLALAMGISDVITRESRIEGFDYHGFDAVCIGAGSIALGVIMLATYTFPPRSSKGVGHRTEVTVIFGIVVIVCYGTALFRNI